MNIISYKLRIKCTPQLILIQTRRKNGIKMLSILDNYTLFSAVTMALALVPLLIMLYAYFRGFEGTILCMDCQQCVAVCPTRRAIGYEYMGPRGIELSARSGNLRMAAEGRLFACTSCMKCVEACPRGLNVKHDRDRLASVLAEHGMGQLPAHKYIINMAATYGNVYDKDKKPLPDIHSQKEKIVGFLHEYAKMCKVEDEIYLPPLPQEKEAEA